ALRRTWQRHDERTACEPVSPGAPPERRVRFKASRALPPAAEGIASPYDGEGRNRHKPDTSWTGPMAHVREPCESTAPPPLTHVHTTAATVHEAQCTTPIQQALIDKELPPREHFVDAASIMLGVARPQPRRPGHHPTGPHTSKPGMADASRGRVHPRAVCGGLGPAAGALPPRPPVYRVVGAWGWAGQSPHHCRIRQARVWAVSRAALLYPGQAHGSTAAAPTPGPVRGAASGADLVCEQGGPAAL